MDADRFPKPDVPWFHEMYPEVLWRTEMFPNRDGTETLTSSNGWVAICGKDTDGTPCPERTTATPEGWSLGSWEMPEGGWYCGMPAGHDGMHIPSRSRSVLALSLHRIARPSEVA